MYMNYKFADRVMGLKPSAIREILKYTSMPGYIPFAAGNPAPEAFPVEAINEISAKLLQVHPVDALQYSITEGYGPLRKHLTSYMKEKHNIGRQFDNTIITSGAQQVMNLSTMALCNPGDTIICENPSFIGSLNAFRSFEVNLAGVDVEPDGMNMEMLEDTINQYHERRKHLTEEEAGETQEQASEDIIRNATDQALKLLRDLQEDRESFRKMGLTFEEKAFYDILMMLREKYNFEYGSDVVEDGVLINKKCKELAKKIKEIIDTKSSFADWLNNQNVRDLLKFDIKICLVKNGYPPQYSPEVFRQVMEQVENFKENE